uniref:GG11712 n=2 Tax=Drosophila erecta TaxID=7220 RepID=B3P820_DROER
MVTTAFLVMDIRLQIEIHIQSGQFNASDLDDVQEGLDDQLGLNDHGSDDESGSDSYTDEEYTNDDGNSEASHYSVDIYDPWGSEDEVDANYSQEMRF